MMIAGMNSVRNISGAPTFPGPLVSVTSRGEALVFDPNTMSVEEENDMSSGANIKKMDGQFSQDIDVRGTQMHI